MDNTKNIIGRYLKMQLFFVGNGYDLTTANPLNTSKTPNFILRNLFTPNVGTFRTGTVQLQR